MKTRERIVIAEHSLRCGEAALAVAAQALTIIAISAHCNHELRAFWARVRYWFVDLRAQLMPERVKRTGRMWDEIEELLRCLP